MNQNKQYQWLFFDADGTLFDYDRAEAHALEATFQDFGLPFDTRSSEMYREINHRVWVDFENGRITAAALRVARFERLFAAAGLAVDPGPFSDRYLYNLSQASDLMAGAAETVRQLQTLYRLAIITNGLKDVQRPRLERSGIADCFEELAISEELGIAKPDPGFFEQVFARIGNPPKEAVLVIGDSMTSDIQGGIRFGLDTCWYNPAGAAPDPRFAPTYEIRCLKELLSLLNHRSAGAS